MVVVWAVLKVDWLVVSKAARTAVELAAQLVGQKGNARVARWAGSWAVSTVARLAVPMVEKMAVCLVDLTADL